MDLSIIGSYPNLNPFLHTIKRTFTFAFLSKHRSIVESLHSKFILSLFLIFKKYKTIFTITTIFFNIQCYRYNKSIGKYKYTSFLVKTLFILLKINDPNPSTLSDPSCTREKIYQYKLSNIQARQMIQLKIAKNRIVGHISHLKRLIELVWVD